MDLVFDIVFGVAFILNTYLWYKLGRDRGYAKGVEKTFKAFKEAMERVVESDEKKEKEINDEDYNNN